MEWSISWRWSCDNHKFENCNRVVDNDNNIDLNDNYTINSHNNTNTINDN